MLGAYYVWRYEIIPFYRQDQQAFTTRCNEAVYCISPDPKRRYFLRFGIAAIQSGHTKQQSCRIHDTVDAAISVSQLGLHGKTGDLRHHCELV